MRSIRTKTERAVLALLFALGAAGCHDQVKPPIGKSRDIAPVHGGVLHTAFFTDVRSLDAATAFDTASQAIEELIYDTLVGYDEHGKLTPLLAKTIDVSSDATRYTFTLRRGVIMQDGNELKASDVKRSIERALDPSTPCPVPSFYDRIDGYKVFHNGKSPHLSGVRVQGDYVVSIQLREPDATFLPKMALPIMAPVCRSAGHKWNRHFSTHACGAGPFRLVHFEGGQVIRLKRFEGYWQKGLPYLDGVVWYLTMQPYTQRFKFEDGDIDYMREFDAADLAAYRSSPAWRGRGGWGAGLSTNGTFLNTEMPPFDNVHVRRAVAFATQRSEIATIRPGVVRPQYKMVPNRIIPDTPGYPGQHFDYRRALEEMRLGGYPYDPKTGKGGYPKVIPYLAILNSFAQQAAEVLQQQLARIGIRIEIQIVGWPTFLAKSEREKTVPMGFAGWNADFPDPSDFFDPILSSAAIQPEDSQNAAFFSNKELDALLVRAHRSTDHAARLAMYRRAEQIVAEQVPWAIAYSYRYFELWQPYVHGYKPHPVLSQYVRNMWFDIQEKKRALADYGPSWLPGVHPGSAPRRGGPRTTLALAEERSR